MAVAFGLIGGFLVWRERAAGSWLVGIAGTFALFGLLLPAWLAPIERGWMWLGGKLSIVSTFVILTLTYVFAVVPIGFLLRVFGKDPMQRRLDPDADTYWTPVDPEGPTSRPQKPF